MALADSDGDVLHYYHIVPIGGIIPWAKSITGVPSLGEAWVECDGSAISDAESPINGQNTPTLNSGNNRMLRGSTTSGSTGGADTHTLTEAELPAHDHSVSVTATTSTGTTRAQGTDLGAGGSFNTGNAGSGNAHNNIPGYTEVVWIMRIK